MSVPSMLDRRRIKGDSTIIKRSIAIAGHHTSVSLEAEFWSEAKQIAGRADVTLAALVGEIDNGRPNATNLSSAIRLAVVRDLKMRLDEGPSVQSRTLAGAAAALLPREPRRRPEKVEG